MLKNLQIKHLFLIILTLLLNGSLLCQSNATKNIIQTETLTPYEDSIVYSFQLHSYYKPYTFCKDDRDSVEFINDTVEGYLIKDSQDTLYGLQLYWSDNNAELLYHKGTLFLWRVNQKRQWVFQSNNKEGRWRIKHNFKKYLFPPLYNPSYVHQLKKDKHFFLENDTAIICLLKESKYVDSMINILYKDSFDLPYRNKQIYFSRSLTQEKDVTLISLKETNKPLSIFDSIRMNHSNYTSFSSNVQYNFDEENDTITDAKILASSCYLTDMNGQKHKLKDIIMDSIILKFWYRGCAPCLLADKQIDSLDLSKNMIVNINPFDRLEDVRKYLIENNESLNNNYVGDRTCIRKLGIRAFPTFIFINDDKITVKKGWSQQRLNWLQSFN